MFKGILMVIYISMLINFLIRLICTYQNVLDIGLSKENHTISKFHAPFITLIKSFPELNRKWTQ